MAQRVVTLYTDDVSGEQGDDVIAHTFSIDGVNYEIDLGPDTYDQFLEALGPFVKAGRKVGGARRSGSNRRQGVGPDPVKVREWAKSQGLEVNDRGRVPRDVVEKYRAAH
ncbi:Lsr2 family protein [Streptomyces sp. DSM 42041]|uniref:Lsr2 family protein n=1 Tax=Streptomyces hazeniae TaxID=3075538 RepID=A0ABU2P0J5_9ACTN|nr:Lsr2 family protein [Streptomyces sp. DSM 42041]MDT0382435.1 Lsr2 family protein [Streptomyces sp. DSM 42041]